MTKYFFDNCKCTSTTICDLCFEHQKWEEEMADPRYKEPDYTWLREILFLAVLLAIYLLVFGSARH